MKKLFGGILLGIGVLIGGASGLCTLVVMGTSIANPAQMSSMIPAALVFGGIPFVIGAAIGWVGWVLIQADKNQGV
ncbi:MAG: hypothetical protein ACM3YM_10090 [Sphingomonadales bacterium]